MLFLALLWTMSGVLRAPKSMVCDTPPAPPPIDRLTQLQSMTDVLGVARLEDGSPVPPTMQLPVFLNRRQAIEYMLVNYPSGNPPKQSQGPAIGWVLVNRRGRVESATLVNPTGNAEYDSLSVRTLRMAEFAPARLGSDSLALWLPLPARVPTRQELSGAIAEADFDKSRTPVELPFDQKPKLLNRLQVEAAVVRVIYQMNPQVAALEEAFRRAQRVGGRTLVWIYIDAQGNVVNAILKTTSGNTDLDGSSLQIAKMMRFAPAKLKGKATDVWIEVPIVFRPR